LSAKPDAQATVAPLQKGLRFYVVSVDFEMIPYKDCRDAAWKLKTNWGLKAHQAEDIADLAGVILSQSTDLKQMYADLKVESRRLQGGKTFKDVCDSLKAHSK
jgi:hypothetical protein